MIRPQGPRANVPLEVLEEPDEAMVGEAHRHAADCWPSGRGPSSSDSGEREVAPPPLTSIGFGWVDGGGHPWPLSKQRPWTESRGESGLFPGTAGPGPPRSPLGWAGSSVSLVCGPPSQRGGGINPGWINQGPSAVPRELTAQETPLGPFELATNAPFPSLPCSGVSRLFTFHRSLGLDCPPLAPPRHSGTPDALFRAST